MHKRNPLYRVGALVLVAISDLSLLVVYSF
jgi:hypothetical protein